MKLIIGLGNPGEDYAATRHNLGFMAVEQLFKDLTPVDKTIWSEEKKFKSSIASITISDKEGKTEKIIIAKPLTYMNNSGQAVSLLASYYNVQSENIWIINDELDLPLGALKIRFGGAGAGHKGVQSIIEQLGTDQFWRFRMGIGEVRHTEKKILEDEDQPQIIAKRRIANVEEYVVGNFTSHEKPEMRKLIKHTSEALQIALEKDLTTAQNRYNTK